MYTFYMLYYSVQCSFSICQDRPNLQPEGPDDWTDQMDLANPYIFTDQKTTLTVHFVQKPQLG